MSTEIDKLLAGDSLESVTFKREQLKALREHWQGEALKAKRKNKHTVERMRELFDYDPETGKFYQKQSAKSGFVPGSEVGSMNPDGYIYLSIDGLLVRAHRVAWALMTGDWPNGDIDHEDRDKANNRFKNLRPATYSQNQANTTMRANSTGRKGVRFGKHGKFAAQIKCAGKVLHLGTHETLDEAAHAYNKAAVALHGEFAVLNPIGVDYE
jgi:hypothetical protein